MEIVKRVTELVLEKIADRPELFLVDVKMLPNNKLIIQVDGDEGITISDCAAISRHVGFHLEEEQVIGHAYNLEVSSPGVGEPLKMLRQLNRNMGRDLGITLKEGAKKEGKLLAADEESITIEEQVKGPGKSKATTAVTTSIPHADILETKVLISFK